MNIYPTNTVQRFRINISSRLNFDENWSVALQSIIYPKRLSSRSAVEQRVGDNSEVIQLTSNAGDHMWIYSDSVEPLLVGDQYHSVLAVCPYAEQGIFMPPTLLYVPVRQGERHSIAVWCADHLGQPYPFDDNGRLIVVLHFKRDH